MKLLKGTFVLKLSALVVAISAYFYIHHQIDLAENKDFSSHEICQKACCRVLRDKEALGPAKGLLNN